MPTIETHVRLVVLLLAVPALLTGCPRSAPPATSGSATSEVVPPEAPQEEEEPTAVETPPPALDPDEVFGGDRMGFVEGWTASGRFAFVRRFPGSPDDPEALPVFGHHGETSAFPELTVFDTLTGEEHPARELIELSADGAWALVVAEESVWLLSDADGTWEDLAEHGVDPAPDFNACLPPRSAAFGAPDQVGWVAADPPRLVMRDLVTGEQTTAASEGLLWRGFPLGDGAAVLLEVEDPEQGFPMQNTSCACRWCNRFALSYGIYGWTGSWRFVEVAADGTRTEVDRMEVPTEDGEPWPCRVEATGDMGNSVERGPWFVSCAEQEAPTAD